VKWTTPFPELGAFITAFITNDGYVGGVTVFGKVMVFSRRDGSFAAPMLELPSVKGPSGPGAPYGLWTGLMDGKIIEGAWRAMFGYELAVANTPAVSPRTGRIFLAAAGLDGSEGRMFGIDFEPGRLWIAFATRMGPGSGTSPAMSPDNAVVYACDDANTMYAFDSVTGEIVWTADIADKATGSPTVADDGMIFLALPNSVQAWGPDGRRRWTRTYDDVAAELVPAVRHPTHFGFAKAIIRRVILLLEGPQALDLPKPSCFMDGIVSAGPDRLYMAAALGYRLNIQDGKVKLPVSKVNVLLVADPRDGSLLGPPVPLRGSPEANITRTEDGTIYVSYGALLQSICYNLLNWFLPPAAQCTPPVGGIGAYEPVSYAELVDAGIRHAQRTQDAAIDALADPAGFERSRTLIARAAFQLSVTANSIIDAERQGEISPAVGRRMSTDLRAASRAVRAAERARSARAVRRRVVRAGQRLAQAIAALNDHTSRRLASHV
jgi:hypothetical protein